MSPDLTAIGKSFDRLRTGFVWSRLRDRLAVEDILQEICLKIHTGLDRLRDSERIEGWIFRIARNAIIDYYRGRRPAVELTEEMVGFEEDREERKLQERLRRDVQAMVDRLPPSFRETIVMTDLGSASQVERARRTGLSFSGAKSRVQRARARLRRMLLDCCHFQFDRMGRVIDYSPRCDRCCAQPAQARGAP